MSSAGRIRTAEAPRRQAIDGSYLRALTNLSAKAPKESELARQVEVERQKLMAKTPPTSGKTNSKNAVVNGTFDAVEDGLQIAAGTRLIEGGRDGIYTFSHDKIRETLYAEVTPGRRTRLHGLIGRVLEARSPAPDAHRLAELAFHFARSGDRGRGVEYSRRAAESALAAHAAPLCRAALTGRAVARLSGRWRRRPVIAWAVL